MGEFKIEKSHGRREEEGALKTLNFGYGATFKFDPARSEDAETMLFVIYMLLSAVREFVEEEDKGGKAVIRGIDEFLAMKGLVPNPKPKEA